MLSFLKASPKPQAPTMVEICTFYSVQRLISKKALEPTPDLRFGQFFDLDYMGASEYEYGAFPGFLRDVHANRDTLVSTQLHINGMDVFVAYSTHNNTLEHVTCELFAIAEGTRRTQCGARFKMPDAPSTKKPRKNSAAARAAETELFFRVDGWAEISLTTFWTVRPMTLELYKQIIANSVAYMDEQKRIIAETV
ncbi:hypothetical protein IFT48_04185 [Pseudomonas fluorescens]|uniref:hypothetical protein n=1 Tax=Pseudomonas fluorescens TaxID=294 RepID=UPI001930CED4|nr:hypothetical protein [Pseudomonas fluorescens]MBD8089170.1 hypothetical protein [Pseudomonas fluorescens]